MERKRQQRDRQLKGHGEVTAGWRVDAYAGRFKLFYTSVLPKNIRRYRQITEEEGNGFFSSADCLRLLNFVSSSIWLYSWVVEFSLSNVRFNTAHRFESCILTAVVNDQVIYLVLLYEIFYSCVNYNYHRSSLRRTEYFFAFFLYLLKYSNKFPEVSGWTLRIHGNCPPLSPYVKKVNKIHKFIDLFLLLKLLPWSYPSKQLTKLYVIQNDRNILLGHLPPPAVYRIRTWAGVEPRIRRREFEKPYSSFFGQKCWAQQFFTPNSSKLLVANKREKVAPTPTVLNCWE